MAITGINNSSYTSYYASNYKNTVKKTDSEKDSTNTKDGNVTTSTVELKTSRPGVTKTEQIKTGYSNVNDYSKYLQGKYHYVNTGTTSMQGVPTTVSVSSAFLQKCMNDPEKAKYLEENLAAIPDCAKSAVNGCLGTLTNLSYKVDENGNISVAISGTNDPDGKIAKENAERKAKENREKEEKVKEKRAAKKAEEEKAAKKRAEKSAEGKMKRTAEALNELILETKGQIDHLESIQNSLDIALSADDLVQIKDELIEYGFIKKGKGSKKQKVKSKPFHYISSDGFDMYVGKNNYQNDELTFKLATGNDWWFHAKGMPGSHVIVKAENKELPDSTFEEAGKLAGYYSKGKNADKVEIDYLQKKNVKKPNGAAAGFVVYYTNYSLTIHPDISDIRQIE